MNRKLLAIAVHGSEAEALNSIVKMTEAERHAAVVILRDVEESIIKFKARLKDLASFYTREDGENFNADQSPDSHSGHSQSEFRLLKR